MSPTTGRRRQTTLERKQAAQDDREAFATEVRTAIRERNLTARDVAAAIGVSPATLNGWLSGSTDPEPRALGDLAAVVGTSHLQLLALAGLLPQDLNEAALRMEAASRFREAIGELELWTKGVSRTTGDSHLGALVDQVLASTDGQCRVEVHPRHRGKKHRLHWDTQLVVHLSSDADNGLEPLYDRLKGACAEAREPYITLHADAAKHSITICVPNVLASHVRDLRPARLDTQTLCIIGDPGAPADVAAALVAEALGWSFETLSTLAAKHAQIQANETTQAEREDALASLLTPGPPSRFLCWAMSLTDVSADAILAFGEQPNLPLICLRSPQDNYVDAIAAMESVLGERTEGSNLEVSTVTRFSSESQDDLVDAGVDTALTIIQWLLNAHEGPSLNAMRGKLGDRWRAISR